MTQVIFFISLFSILVIINAISSSLSCSSSTQCSRNRICLNDKCQSCTSNSQCLTASPSTPYCKSDRFLGNSCQECLINDHCTSVANAQCLNNKCSPCTTSSDCTHIAGNLPICDNGICVQCRNAGDCTSPYTDCNSGFCAEPVPSCTSCTNLVYPYCDGTYCESCGANPSVACPSNLCSPDGSCQQCFEDWHCTTPQASQCVIDPINGNSCRPCSQDADCAYIHGLNKCLLSTSPKCVECLSTPDCSAGYGCVNNVCVASSATPLEITVSGTDTLDAYLIDFPEDLVTNTDPEQGLNIELDGIDSSTYNYTLTKLSDTEYQVQFIVTKTIPITTLLIVYTYIPYGSSADDIFSQYDTECTTKRIPYIPENQRAISVTMESIGQAAITAMVAASGSIIVLGGNPAILWALISLIQTFYYLMFVNVNYPGNVQFFFKIFTPATSNFIPNPITWFNPDLSDYSLPVPARFAEYDINGLFLDNAGNMLLIWFAVLVIYVFLIVGYKYLNRLSRIVTLFFAKMVGWFEWGAVLRALMASYPDLAQSSFLQLRVLTYDSSTYAASSVLSILFTLYLITFPLLTIMLIKKFCHLENKTWKKFKALTEEYTSEGTYPKYFTGFFLIKRLLTMLSLVFLHDYSYIEILFLTFLSFLTIILLIKFKPYETKAANYLNIATEVLFFIVHILIIVLIYDDHTTNFTDNQRLNIGWGLIGVCGIIVLISFGVIAVEQVKMLIEIWKRVKQLIQLERKRKERRRIIPLRYIEKPEDPLTLPALTIGNISVSDSSVIEKSQFMMRQEVENLHGLGRIEQLRIDSSEASVCEG